MNTNGTQAAANEEPIVPGRPAEFPRADAATPDVVAAGRINSSAKKRDDLEPARQRRYEESLDLTQHGATMPPSLPKFGRLCQTNRWTVDALERAWGSLFNEREQGAKLLESLRTLGMNPDVLRLNIFEVRARDGQTAPVTYLLVAQHEAELEKDTAQPVAQYLITCGLFSTIVKTVSPVKALSIYRFGPKENPLDKYKLYEEAKTPVAGPTEEVKSTEGSIFEGWHTWNRFLELLPAHFWFHDDQFARINGWFSDAVNRAGVSQARVQITQDSINNGRYLVRLAPDADAALTLMLFIIQAGVLEAGKLHVNEVALQQLGGRAMVRHIVLPETWLRVGELAYRWKSIFNEDQLGQAVISRLGDMEKRLTEGDSLVLRIVQSKDPLERCIEVYETYALPGMIWSKSDEITKNGQPVMPRDLIRVQVGIVEGVEMAVRLKVQGDFMSEMHAPKGTPEDAAAAFTHYSQRAGAVINLYPSDIRTFDPIAFQQFVDQVRQANLSIGDSTRLVAFMEFIAKCQQIDSNLFFHCTAYGQQLERVLGGARAAYPGAAAETPRSVFAPGGRWGGFGAAGPHQNGTGQQAVRPTLIAANQLAADVVITVYGSTGALLGVFQCAVPPAGHTVA